MPRGGARAGAGRKPADVAAKPTQVMLTEFQRRVLSEAAKSLGIRRSELVRRILDAVIRKARARHPYG